MAMSRDESRDYEDVGPGCGQRGKLSDGGAGAVNENDVNWLNVRPRPRPTTCTSIDQLTRRPSVITGGPPEPRHHRQRQTLPFNTAQLTYVPATRRQRTDVETGCERLPRAPAESRDSFVVPLDSAAGQSQLTVVIL